MSGGSHHDAREAARLPAGSGWRIETRAEVAAAIARPRSITHAASRLSVAELPHPWAPVIAAWLGTSLPQVMRWYASSTQQLLDTGDPFPPLELTLADGAHLVLPIDLSQP